MNAGARILVVDDDAVSRHVLSESLAAAGFQVTLATSGAEAIAALAKDAPSLVLLDLIMPEPDGYAVLRYIRSERELAELPVVVLTALDADNDINRIFASGADDYVHKPFREAELVARIRGQLRLREYVDRLSRREREAQTVLELTQTLASSLEIHEILYTLVQRVARLAHVDRCSIVLAKASDDEVGFVVATSDDAALKDLPINLRKYPEIRQVLKTHATLIIEDAATHPLLQAVRDTGTELGYASLALVPIVHKDRAIGVIFLRAKQAHRFIDTELSLIETIASATAIALRNARMLQSLRAATQKSAVARAEAEKRVLLFQRYADFFDSAADGMLVLDDSSCVLFANPKAREITGLTEAKLIGMSIVDVFAPSERERAQRLTLGFPSGVFPQGIDIALETPRATVINVSFSSVLHEEGAVLLTFRDVTVERRTEIELRQTKEFLERVIESSVDSIVSADLNGTVLLFNSSASRLFGYAPEEVVGQKSVEALYPPGVSREVMRLIRDSGHGGPGRLEEYRVDMLGADGVAIPVVLSAALIVDGGKPTGSVGIFTDLRNQLRMEAELSSAQLALQNRQKQALIAELAGTAAHELNQPLTSVIGYAELLRRHVDKSTHLAHAVDVISTEAERMADIVRKIGKITKYETKAYVGSQNILDLDRAAEGDASASSDEPSVKQDIVGGKV